MKATFLLFISLCITTMLQAQVSKTIEVTAGNLKTVLKSGELNTVTNLTLSGTIDARDFKTMRDQMPLLSYLNISAVQILEYKGNDATNGTLELFYPANAIAAFAFCNSLTMQGKSSLNTVILPGSILSIDRFAFCRCTALISVNIPSSLKYIMDRAFQDCISLKSISIPSSVSYIWSSAFENCGCSFTVDWNSKRYSAVDGILFNKKQSTLIQCPNTLSGDFVIPSSVRIVGVGAFSGCEKLNSVIIPETVNAIGSRAFLNCKNLKSITIQISIPPDLSRSEDVFSGVDLNSCVLIVMYESKQNYMDAEQWNDFVEIAQLPGMEILKKQINISDENGGRDSVVVNSNTDWTVISNDNWLTAFPTSGAGKQTVTITASRNTDQLSRYGSVTVSLNGGRSETIEVTQQEARTIVRTIDFANLSYEFRYSVKGLKLIDTIDIRDFWFISDNMHSLNLLDLSEATIRDFTRVDTLEFYNGYYYNGYYYYYKNDKEYYPAYEFPPNTFYYYDRWNVSPGNSSLKTIILPSSLTSIADEAFKNFTTLTSVNIPPGVTRIGNGAFSGCKSLTSVTIPKGITRIEDGAFSGDTSLTSITIPESVKTIGAGAFSGCSSLTSITIPSGVTSIDNEAFSNCTGLISVDIPASVTFLGDDVFSNCSNLTAFYLGSHNFYQICDNYMDSFAGINDGKCTLYVPCGSKDAYNLNSYLINFKDIVEFSFIELSATEISIATSQDAVENVTIWSDLTWTASTDQDWLFLESNSGTGDQTLYFGIESNTSNATRAAKITFSAPGVKSQTITVTQEGIPTAVNDLALATTQFKCYPNPFTEVIAIEIQNPKRAEISVDIYNLAGEKIKNLASQRKDERLDLVWNGTNDSGQKVVPGVYICKVNNRSKRLVYLGQKEN